MQTCSSSLLPSVSSPKNVQLDANTPDKIVWKWTVNGEYSAWLIIKNRVWTSDRLAARGWPRNEVCPLCRQVLETAHHQDTRNASWPYGLAGHLWLTPALWILSLYCLGTACSRERAAPRMSCRTRSSSWIDAAARRLGCLKRE